MPCLFWISIAFLFYFYLIFQSIFMIITWCLFSGFIFISLILFVMTPSKYHLLYLDMMYFQHALSFLDNYSLSFLFLPYISIDFMIITWCLFSGFIFISLLLLVMIPFKYHLLYLDMRYFQHALSFLDIYSLSYLFLPYIILACLVIFGFL